MSTVWEDTDGCSNKYRCALAIYIMAVLSSLYGVIMDRVINADVHVKNVVDGINTTDKLYLKGGMELLGKLSGNKTSKFGMIPSAPNMLPFNLKINIYTL